MKLFVINTPCWMDLSAQGLNNQKLFVNPFSDHFTFLYMNFMKYGLADEVHVFVEDKRWVESGDFSQRKVETEYGNIFLHKEDKKSEIINSYKEGFLYCWSKWKDCAEFSDKFILVNPMFNGLQYENEIDPSVHNYALIEGSAYVKYLPKNMPYDVLRYISHDCIPKNKKIEKKYDWIMVSSFDPRKRHLEFLKSLYGTTLQKTKGCIIGRDPDNKGRIWAGHRVLREIEKNKSLFNYDVHINATQQEKNDLLKQSKIFVCVSTLDNGPRAQIEAAQLKLPILSMPHIGSSDIILSGKNGEIINDVSFAPPMLDKMLTNIESYNCEVNDDILNPDNFMPKIVNNILKKYENN